MKRIDRIVILAALTGMATLPALAQTDPFLWDQSDLDTSDGANISEFVATADFATPLGERIDGVTVFLVDGVENDNGVFDSFGGTLSYCFYTKDGKGDPDVAFNCGVATSPTVVDTGVDDDYNGDVFRVSFPLVFPWTGGGGADSYWFALHEGDWLSPYDGSAVWWIATVVSRLSVGESSNEETGPTTWVAVSYDSAMTLWGGPRAGGLELPDSSVAGTDITSQVAADHLPVSGATTALGVDIFLNDGATNDNGVLDNFNGTIGWAIYDDDSGAPGSVVASGSDAAPQLFDVSDTSAGQDIFRVRVAFGRRVDLPAGDYWLAIREGTWGSPGDGTSVEWTALAITTNGPAGGLADADEASPSAWDVDVSDLVYTLLWDPVFLSGFEADTTCAWSNTVGGSLCP